MWLRSLPVLRAVNGDSAGKAAKTDENGQAKASDNKLRRRRRIGNNNCNFPCIGTTCQTNQGPELEISETSTTLPSLITYLKLASRPNVKNSATHVPSSDV